MRCARIELVARRRKRRPVSSRILLAALLFEIALFAAVAPQFLTVTNFVEVMRLSVEVGLLAIAMTPNPAKAMYRRDMKQRRRMPK